MFCRHTMTPYWIRLPHYSQGLYQISPLLWVIYYDPLFCYFKSMKEQFTIEVTHCTNVNPFETTFLKILLNLLRYLDDITMIAFSKQNLEDILSISDSFYQLNNIKINKSKSISRVIPLFNMILI